MFCISFKKICRVSKGQKISLLGGRWLFQSSFREPKTFVSQSVVVIHNNSSECSLSGFFYISSPSLFVFFDLFLYFLKHKFDRETILIDLDLSTFAIIFYLSIPFPHEHFVAIPLCYNATNLRSIEREQIKTATERETESQRHCKSVRRMHPSKFSDDRETCTNIKFFRFLQMPLFVNSSSSSRKNRKAQTNRQRRGMKVKERANEQQSASTHCSSR